MACEGCACGQPYEERHLRWLVYLWDGGTLHDCIWACSEVRGMVVFVMLVLGTPHGCGMRACLCYQSMFCNSQSPWLGYEGMVVIPEHVLQLAVPMVVVWGHVYEVQALFTHHSRLTLCSHMFLVQPANVLPMHMHLPAWYEGMFMKFRLFSHRDPGSGSSHTAIQVIFSVCGQCPAPMSPPESLSPSAANMPVIWVHPMLCLMGTHRAFKILNG